MQWARSGTVNDRHPPAEGGRDGAAGSLRPRRDLRAADIAPLIQSFVASHAADAALVAAGFAVATLSPRRVPLVAVLAVTFQSLAPRSLTSDGDILLGMALGLAVARLRSREDAGSPTAARVVRALRGNAGALALIGLAGAALLSLALNAGAEQGPAALSGTEYLVTRTVLVLAVVLLAGADRENAGRWLDGIAVAGILLAAFRFAELAGVPVASVLDRARIPVLGDLKDVGSWNAFAVVLVVALAALTRWARSPAAAVFAGAAGILVGAALSTTTSRTGIAIAGVVVVAVLVLARGWTPRAVVVLAGVAILAGSTNATLGVVRKPVIVGTQQLSDDKVATAVQPTVIEAMPTPAPAGPPPPSSAPRPPLPALRPDWRAILDRNYLRARQEFTGQPVYPEGNRIEFVARRSALTDAVRLRVTVNGTELVSLPASRVSPYYAWVEVAVPDGLLRPDGTNEVILDVTGTPDSSSDFFAVGGVNARATGLRSTAWSGSHWLSEDLSSDPGLQQGTLLVFLNGSVPALAPFTPRTGATIDPSIGDRLVLWQTALRVFAAHPLAGTGFYTFGAVKGPFEGDQPVFSPYVNAHDNYLELLSDLGVQGPLCLLLAIALPLWASGRAAWRSREPVALALALALVAFGASSVTQAWIADSRVYLLCWAAVLLGASRAVAAARAEGA